MLYSVNYRGNQHCVWNLFKCVNNSVKLNILELCDE